MLSLVATHLWWKTSTISTDRPCKMLRTRPKALQRQHLYRWISLLPPTLEISWNFWCSPVRGGGEHCSLVCMDGHHHHLSSDLPGIKENLVWNTFHENCQFKCKTFKLWVDISLLFAMSKCFIDVLTWLDLTVQYLRFYTNPAEQRWIVRILFIVPL